MKKKTIIYVIINIILALFTGLLSVKVQYDTLATVSKYLSLTFGVLTFIILLNNLYKKLIKKDNSKSLMIISTIVYAVFSMIYGVIIYTAIGGTILQMTFMILFYISLVILILIYSSIFYFWISKDNIKYIIRMLVILLTIIALCLVFTLISKHITVSSLLILTLNFVYVSSILLLSAFMVIYIVHKLVLPIDKK